MKTIFLRKQDIYSGNLILANREYGCRKEMTDSLIPVWNENCGGLDRFRILAAVLVVAIHTSPLTSFSADADFFLTRILARIAVPFFLMVTGQFVVSRYLYDHDQMGGKDKDGKLWKSLSKASGRAGKAVVFSCIKKTALLYGAAIIIYIPIGLYAGHYKDLTAGDAVKMLIFDGTFYHLWYFPACIMGVFIVYLMSRFMGIKKMMVMSAILYMIGLFGDSYFGLIEKIPVISSIYELGFRLFSYTRNGFFFVPIFLILGAEIGRKGRLSKDICLTGLSFSFLAMTVEAFTLRYFALQRHDSMYFSLVFVMFFLYELLLLWEKKPSSYLRTAATWIYILHPAVIIVVRGAAKALHMTEVLVENSLIHYIAVTLTSVLTALLIAYLTGRRKKNPPIRRQGKVFCTSRIENGRHFNGRRTGKENYCYGRAWIELDREALKQNVTTLRAKLPEQCRLMPALKADAYGHGAVLIAKELNRMGVDAFCVACISEGVELRRKGVRGEILILGYTHPAQFPLLHRFHLTQTVIDCSYAVQLNRYGRKIHVHIGIDTGMHRLGERSENIEKICGIFEMKNLVVDGLFTHLCAADTLQKQDREFTGFQAAEFYKVVDGLKKRGYACPKLHLQSSYSVFNYPELAEDYARVGIALYGVLSTRKDTKEWKDVLKPVLSFKTRVASVKKLYAGESAGYGMDFVAKSDMKIAALAVGYADGLPRTLSGGVGAVLINGHKAPVIGRICMDQTIVDVSDIKEVKAGDIAVIIGKSGELAISACDLARQTGTITNEILSRMGKRLERVVV